MANDTWFDKHSMHLIKTIDVLSKYAKLIKVNVDHIENIGGGGIRCMMAEIYSLSI